MDKLALRQLRTSVLRLRPVASDPEGFNAQLDAIIGDLESLRQKAPKTREVDVTQASDRMHRGPKSTRKRVKGIEAGDPTVDLRAEGEPKPESAGGDVGSDNSKPEATEEGEGT